MEKNKLGLTRRELLRVGAAGAAGVLVTGLAGCSSKPAPAPATAPAPAAAPAEAPALPWEYKKLDVEKVRKLGYENYFKGGCMYAAATALLAPLQEAVGGPWKTIPFDAYKFGAGGAYGWGTLCGALNGALQVISMATKDHAALGNELIGWYTLFPFPSDKHEAYCKFPKQITTVANSPLCHVSVTKWANEAKAKINAEAKYDRCAKLSGDTAAYAAEMLNAALEGKFTATFKVPEEYAACMPCHVGKDSTFDNVQGKMDCLDCHDNHLKK